MATDTKQVTCQKQPKTYQKTRDAMQLVNAGIDPELALKFANQKDKIRPETVSRFKQKLKKHTLTSPVMVKSAANQVKRILAGEVREIEQQVVTKSGQVVDYIEHIAPSDANILAAASMVYDRYEPVIKGDAGNTTNIGSITVLSPALEDAVSRLAKRSEHIIDIAPQQPDNSGDNNDNK